MGTQPPPVTWLRKCQRCKQDIPKEQGAVHCTSIPCVGAVYHNKCWVDHAPCRQGEQ